ncbi:hypothetical protein GUJ93_ZPchr0006g41229 [Zizania palustris]|uniref:Terpene synthase N-terminal domain-containing protein n=1 Tax=Zizania palustris TaxID=103762 RepID=A0A8J5T7D3_ZIZPA|nr:hypothetical protein GUJ93_ZPchr0006g41229 [Zizania palustris]
MIMPAFTVAPSCVHLLRPTAPQPWRQPFPQLHCLHTRRHSSRRLGSMVHCKAQLQGAVRGERPQTDDGSAELSHVIESMRAEMRSMGGGEINVSAYDTAWVALVHDLNGGDAPQFPAAVDWIVRNQLPDGSWGDAAMFLVHDRILSTLACVVALTSWNMHADQCDRGLSFIRKNIWRLGEEEEDWMLIGFEITFPSLIEMAKGLGLDIPCDDPAVQEIYARRNLKLTKIPREVLHTAPTSLLYSIEGMVDLDWNRLLKLRCPDGSFLSSPAATAYALQQTGDQKCLKYIDEIVTKFNGGVPCVYPVDTFEHLWTVDRLNRLGISRYFTNEIRQCMDYAYRHWSESGFGSAWDSPVKDIDDTAMGFRLLRSHGYDVSPDVFRNFEKDGEFFCFVGQSSQSVTAFYNTYRAIQLAFPGDEVLGWAERYCGEFLRERRAAGKLYDKWVIAKDLPGEVGYALDFPWKASLPRVETRMYLEQYGGSDDVWIGKVLYRMPFFCNGTFLKAAKADFTNFQRLSRLEWHGLKRWYDRNNLQEHGVTLQSALRAYFVAAANIFEPNRAAERLGWARTAVLAEAVASHLRSSASADSVREWLVNKLTSDSWDKQPWEAKDSAENRLLYALDELIDHLALGCASESLRETWKKWLMSWPGKGREVSREGDTALLLVRTVEICAGRHGSTTDQKMSIQEYSQLEQITSSICHKLSAKVLAQVSTKYMDDVSSQIHKCVF